MKIKYRVKITQIVEVEDVGVASEEAAINAAHGPDGEVQSTEAEVTAVQIDGKWFEAPPF